MEARQTVGYRKYIGSMSTNGYPGAPAFDPPENLPAVSRPAYGWYPMSSSIPLGNPEYVQRVIASMVVGVPDVTIYAPGDLVVLAGVDYVVSEDVRDYTHGPISPGPGGEVIVERVSG